MTSGETGPTSAKDQGFIDYSVVYREKEIKQLKKRLRKTRNILLIASIAFLLGGMIFRLMPDASFTTNNLMYYIIMSILLTCIAFLSKRKPYRYLLLALIVCIVYWGGEIILRNTDNLLIEGTIHKLSILSLLISGLHTSKEAELIKKELHYT